jgi:hypothetical protein
LLLFPCILQHMFEIYSYCCRPFCLGCVFLSLIHVGCDCRADNQSALCRG